MKYFTLKGENPDLIATQIRERYKGDAYIIKLDKEKVEIQSQNTGFSRVFKKYVKGTKVLYKAYCAVPENYEEQGRLSHPKEKPVVHNEVEELDQKPVLKQVENKEDTFEQISLNLLTKKIDQFQNIVLDTLKENEENKKGLYIDVLKSHMLKNDFSYEFTEFFVSNFSFPIKDLEIFNVILKEKFKLKCPPPLSFIPRKRIAYVLWGMTGVGKTTTLAKIASKIYQQGFRSLKFVSFDTYKLAASDQLRQYAEIFNKHFYFIQNDADFNVFLDEMQDDDIILIDTPGENLDSNVRLDEINQYLSKLKKKMEIHSVLLLPANGKSFDLKDTKIKFSALQIDSYIITKIDETRKMGSILETLYGETKPVLFVTCGQSVPEDIKDMNIEIFFDGIKNY